MIILAEEGKMLKHVPDFDSMDFDFHPSRRVYSLLLRDFEKSMKHVNFRVRARLASLR